MSSSKDDAVQKFWATPELVEKLLLPFLDTGSTKHLAEAHGLTLEVLGKVLSWDKLIKRTFPMDQRAGIVLESENLKARFLAEIVIMTKNSNSAQMASNWVEMERVLLHCICKRFPANPARKYVFLPRSPLIAVSCSCLETHQVSPWGFLLLEEVESKLESVEQNVLRVVAWGWERSLVEPILSALSARVLRQHNMAEELVFGDMVCNNKNSAEAWAALVEKSNAFSAHGFWDLIAGEGIGADGWAAIRRVVERLSTAGVTPIRVEFDRKTMGEGRRGDLEAIWKVTSSWRVHNVNSADLRFFKTKDGRPGSWGARPGMKLRTWRGMDQIIDMSEQEWLEWLE